MMANIISVFVMCSLCFIASKSDIESGIIKNKILAIYGIYALIFNLIRFVCGDMYMVKAYIINVTVVIVICLVLFYTHSLAGGDCKLAMVLALLYPYDCYLIYDKSIVTLYFSIGMALIYGYIYLVFSSLFLLIKRKNKITKEYVINYVRAYLISFISASLYISLLCDCAYIMTSKGIRINVWGFRIICIIVAVLVGRYNFLRKRMLLAMLLVLVTCLSVSIKYCSLIGDVNHYLFVAVMLLCQMSVRTNLYENIAVEELKSKMILSTATSISMQSSRVRGLPGISTEDLRDRLTESQVESIKRWAKGNHIETISIVKKIPFAIFVSLGFVSCFVLWGLV